MSLAACIPDLIAAGKLTKKQGEAASQAYDRHYAALLRDMSPEAAAAEASRRALAELEYGANHERRVKVLAAVTQRRVIDEMNAHAKGVGEGGMTVIDRAHELHRAIVGRAHATLVDVLRKHSRNLLGEARDKAGLADIVRERFGESTGNADAKAMADATGEAMEYLRERRNRAGGATPQRDDWGLPQAHDQLKIRAAGANKEAAYQAWREFTASKLAVERMVDGKSGQAFTPETLEEALRGSFDSIWSNGWDDRRPGNGGMGSNLAYQRMDPRFLVFKSADDWMAYQQKFGAGSAFDIILSHVEHMAREIGLMETMGPNPKATLKLMQDHVRSRAETDPNPKISVLDRARSAEKRMGDLYQVVSGEIFSPVNQGLARTMGAIRNYETASALGSAMLSATTDVGFQAVTRAYNGLPIMGAITGYLKLLNPAASADRRIAVRLGLQAEEAARRMAALNRFVDAGQGPEVLQRMADATLRASGLNIWTQAGKWDFGMSLLGHLADMRDRGFDKLTAANQGMLRRYGISAADWEGMRSADTYRKQGLFGAGEWMDPLNMDERLGDKLLMMALSETDYAVPSVTARTRALMSMGQRPGTLGGEILRSGGLFKSFGVGIILTHGHRMMEMQTGYGRLAYFSGLTITTTLLGAMALQLREIVQGRDMKDMSQPGFWAESTAQGGGFGIFGDFIRGLDQTAYGNTITSVLAGPVAQLAQDTIGTAGTYAYKGARNAIHAMRGESTRETVNPGGDAVRLLKRYTPGGSLWYLRTAYNRYVLDQLQQLTDPDYQKSWDRMERRAAKQGQEYFWHPGELAPDRAPRMATMPPQ